MATQRRWCKDALRGSNIAILTVCAMTYDWVCRVRRRGSLVEAKLAQLIYRGLVNGMPELSAGGGGEYSRETEGKPQHFVQIW